MTKTLFSQILKLHLFLFFLYLSIPICAGNSDSQVAFEQQLQPYLLQAQKEQKTILLTFVGDGWCHWSKRLTNEVFKDPKVFHELTTMVIPFIIKLPQSPKALSPTELALQHYILKRYQINALPTFIFITPQGVAFSRWGFTQEGGERTVQGIRQIIQAEKRFQAQIKENDEHNLDYAKRLDHAYQQLPKNSQDYHLDVTAEIVKIAQNYQDKELVQRYVWSGVIVPFLKTQLQIADEQRQKELQGVQDLLQKSKNDVAILQQEKNIAFIKAQTSRTNHLYRKQLRQIICDLEKMNSLYSLSNDEKNTLYFFVAQLYTTIGEKEKAISILEKLLEEKVSTTLTKRNLQFLNYLRQLKSNSELKTDSTKPPQKERENYETF